MLLLGCVLPAELVVLVVSIQPYASTAFLSITSPVDLAWRVLLLVPHAPVELRVFHAFRGITSAAVAPASLVMPSLIV
jgi:hypothetical protein